MVKLCQTWCDAREEFYCFSLTLPSSGHLEKTHTKTNPHIGVIRGEFRSHVDNQRRRKKKFFFSFFRMNVRARAWESRARLLLRAHETLEVGSVDHATVNLELGEGVVDLGGGELVAEGHEGVSEGLSVDLAVNVEGVEGLEDGLVVVSAASHLAGEEGHHLGEVHGAIGLIKHALGLPGGDGLAVVAEGGHQVGGAEETVLVDVHDAEGFLELLQGRVGELVENVGLLGHVEASADEVERELDNK